MKRFYILLGPERCRSLGYDYSKMTYEVEHVKLKDNAILNKIYQEFSVGIKITKAEAKAKLVKLYQEVGYGKTPKAVDLQEWFEIKRAQIKDQVTGKFSEGFELLAKKTN
jgi:hypothetical protein